MLTSKPVPGPSACVGDSYDLDPGYGFAENDEERESVEEIAAGSTHVRRPVAGGLLDAYECGVELGHEGVGGVCVPH